MFRGKVLQDLGYPDFWRSLVRLHHLQNIGFNWGENSVKCPWEKLWKLEWKVGKTLENPSVQVIWVWKYGNPFHWSHVSYVFDRHRMEMNGVSQVFRQIIWKVLLCHTKIWNSTSQKLPGIAYLSELQADAEAIWSNTTNLQHLDVPR